MFEVDSAGTGNYHIGEQPDPRTLKNARANGVILNHKCRQFVEQDFYDFDYIIAMDDSNIGYITVIHSYYIIAMDDSNIANILKIKPEAELNVKIMKMRQYDPLQKDANVPDPWFGGEKGLRRFTKYY